jgi:hypothetical protein
MHISKWQVGGLLKRLEQLIGPRRNCFPLPSDYSLGGSQISLDKLTINAITNIISYKKRRPPNALAIAKWQDRANLSGRPYE